MFGSSIKLTSRKDFKQVKEPRRNKSKMLEDKLFVKSDYYHSYSFRWDKSKRYINCSNNTAQSVTINNILFPENIHGLNTGASLQKWANKRPRLKSSKIQKKSNPEKDIDATDTKDSENEESLSFNEITLKRQFSKEVEEQNKECDELTEELDPDIQRLLSISQENSMEQDEEEKKEIRKKRHRKRDKIENPDKPKSKKRTRMIKFSLSKPQSPQTVQVIRVDVTSNFSMHEVAETNRTDANISDCSKGCGKRIRSGIEAKKVVLKKQMSLHSERGDEINLLCKKLTLAERTDEQNHNSI